MLTSVYSFFSRLRSLISVQWSQFSFRNQGVLDQCQSDPLTSSGTIQLPKQVLAWETLGRVIPRALKLEADFPVSPCIWTYVSMDTQTAKLLGQDCYECECGSAVKITVTVRNVAAAVSPPTTLALSPYQDAQTGEHNTNLTNCLAFIGAAVAQVPELQPNETFTHSVGVVIFAAGEYRFSLTCAIQASSDVADVPYLYESDGQLVVSALDRPIHLTAM